MFNINGVEWEVELVPPLHPQMFRSDGSLTIGACDNLTQTIYINWSLNDAKFKKVLCHEIVHAAMFSYNILLNINEEELLADLFATYGEEIIDVTNNIFHRMRIVRTNKEAS